jgi:hypothetical protein
MKSLAFLALASFAQGAVVINEVYFAPPDQQPLEFIELYNPEDLAVSLAGWTLDEFTFPPGTAIAPHGYLVVAQNPEALEKAYGVKALGPFPGKLSNDGEKLTLSDARKKVVEEFKYGVGFPWPSSSLGGGSSLERLNPSLAAGEPGHWRAAGFASTAGETRAFVKPGSVWHYRRGDREASAPAGAWRAAAFPEDSAWQSGKAGIGYGDDDDATVLSDMQGRYSCIFLRQKFTVTGPLPPALQLRLHLDDGCIVWLNGKEIARLRVPEGEPTIRTLAEDHEATGWENVILSSAGKLLLEGENTLAVQVFNSSLRSSDLSFDLALQTPPAGTGAHRPTPGAANSVFTTAIPPVCQYLRHLPEQPKPGEPVTITASFHPGTPVGSAVLQLQAVEPGAYLRKTDPDYATRWQDLPMHDDGKDGDAVSGDHEWSVTIPAEMQTNRRLLRYRCVATGTDGARVQLPYPDDDVPNFAYYVWAGPPDWKAAMQPGRTPELTFTGAFQRTLPIFTLLANADDVAHSQWDGGYNKRKLSGTMVYDGKVYDHMEFKNRGSASTYNTGKNKWGFAFANAHDLQMRDPWGRLYKKTWNSFAMNAAATPWVQINRGMSGLDEAISFRAYQLAGVPASDTVPIHFRVVTTKEEQGATQFAGDLWGLYMIVEDVDGAFLDNHQWPDGITVSPEKGLKHLPDGLKDKAQKAWDELNGGPRGKAEEWWRTHLDIQGYASFHAINRLVGNVDLRPGANYHFYQNPTRGWMPVPWDLDMQFIPRTHQPGYIDQIRCLEVPAIKIEFQARAREILDLLASDPRPDGGQIGQVIAEYARRIEPKGSVLPAQSWGMLDACVWDEHPRSNSRGTYFVSETRQDMFGGSFSRKLATPDFAGFCKYVLDYTTDTRPKKNYQPNDGNPLGYGWGYLAFEAQDAAIPEKPAIKYAGPEKYPLGELKFSITPFADPQGEKTCAAVQWRIGEIGTPADRKWLYEIEPVWLGPATPLTAPAAPEMTIPADKLRPARTYRARARYQDQTGRWSHWSDPVQFSPTK